MQKTLLFSLVALAVGITACSNDSFPTHAERDLLHNPDNVPTLDGSKFGQAIANDGDVEEPVPDDEFVDPVSPYEATPDSTAGSVHIRDSFNRSKYKPSGYVHLAAGANKSKYIPEGWEHYNGTPVVDRTKYLPPRTYHISSGPNVSYYQTKP